MENIKQLIGKRIKELRKSKNMTQEQLAELLEIDQRSLSAIECGVNFPTKNLLKIAEVFKIQVKDLFDFEHIELTEQNMKKEVKSLIDNLTLYDLKIVYRLIKLMNA